MRWNEIDVVVSKTATDLVALLLYECGSNGSIIHDDQEDEQGRIRITAYFPPDKEGVKETVTQGMEALADRTPALGPWLVLEKTADDNSWLYTWQDYFHPKKISPHFWAAPAWERIQPPEGEDVILIDPGLAFGSGLHDTTCMCVEYLEEAIHPDDFVFDIGTGTGILAIAAAKLGASHVTAVDFDKKAVHQAKRNARLNGVADKISVYNSDLLTAIAAGVQRADVIVANLVTDAVLALMPTVTEYMIRYGVFIASGIIDDRIDEVRQGAAENGLAIEHETLRNGWYALYMRRQDHA